MVIRVCVRRILVVRVPFEIDDVNFGVARGKRKEERGLRGGGGREGEEGEGGHTSCTSILFLYIFISISISCRSLQQASLSFFE